MQHKTMFESWIRRVWEDEDLDAIHEMFRPDATAHGLVDGEHVGPDEFAVFAGAMLQLIGEVRAEIRHYVEMGDSLAAVIKFSAVDRRTEQPVSFMAQAFCRVADGIFVEGYNHFDAIGLYEQLDLLPPSTFEICLMGEKIG